MIDLGCHKIVIGFQMVGRVIGDLASAGDPAKQLVQKHRTAFMQAMHNNGSGLQRFNTITSQWTFPSPIQAVQPQMLIDVLETTQTIFKPPFDSGTGLVFHTSFASC